MFLPLILLYSAVLVVCNTEIVNFAINSQFTALSTLPNNLPTLRFGAEKHNFLLPPAPLGSSLDIDSGLGRLFVKLDCNDATWSTFEKFTLRISWPANYPSDFSIELFDSQEERAKIACITVIDAGILTPHPAVHISKYPLPVPFDVILEPLYFGVVPKSVCPVAASLLFIIAVAAFLAPKVHGELEALALEARKDIMLGSIHRRR
ncbi:hypothetical protein CYLTODRAFT_491813 [Cylindrobasidium torrendii FP15055 ss-10]|uniref:Uncharacterized protein n=1 Tax=Cylindrobasidium torrendii FP15055 ss-10 TaxID=1314674 RepID=A0A0D7B638_9AGAR|nr:hypothetical protein CYLTODRAFT_491813 [Cylindrobasidium torrendii FP15055 ss-10]